MLRSHIAYPSPRLTDDPHAHGLAFKAEDITETKALMGLPDEPFHIDAEVADYYRAAGARGAEQREAWEKRLASWTGDRAAFDAARAGNGTAGWQDALPSFEVGEKVATRAASGKVFGALAGPLPGLLGGGADLSGNTGTQLEDQAQQSKEHPEGRQIYFGVREHAMGGVLNGLAAHGGVLPVGGTFFVFSDYMRGAVRLAALSGHQVIYSWTHDSVGLGEDGPTHQPVEHLPSLRAMPGLRVVRPADANEVVTAWVDAIAHDGPTALVLSRQNLPVLDGTASNAGVSKGAYVLHETGPADTDADLPDLVLVASGSEVWVCLDAAATLAEDALRVRVVSMPCWEDFEAQDEEYQASVLPAAVPTLAVEAASSFGWERWADDTVAIDRFGASAPGDTVLAELGIEPGHVVGAAQQLLDDTEPVEAPPA